MDPTLGPGPWAPGFCKPQSKGAPKSSESLTVKDPPETPFSVQLTRVLNQNRKVEELDDKNEPSTVVIDALQIPTSLSMYPVRIRMA